MMIIENSIPLPESTRQRKYPFVDMEPGDSAYFEEKLGGKAYKAAKAVGDRYNREYIARKENGGIRVWRKA
jgi:hypothetical protein